MPTGVVSFMAWKKFTKFIVFKSFKGVDLSSCANDRIDKMFCFPLIHEMGLIESLILLLTILFSRCSYQNENTCETLEEKCLRVAALIPARAGSKGIENKNLAVIGNETLLSRTLRIVHESDIFDSVWVLTNGEAIANEATKHGGKIHWRDPRTATDNATTLSAVEDFLLKQKDYDIIAVIQCTSPFLQWNFLRNALEIMLNNSADCIFSVTRSFQLRWNESNDGFVSPINFNPKKRPRRQDWKGELVENGMLYFLKPILVLRDKVLQNNRCRTLEIPKEFSLEIDTQVDLLLARTLLPFIDKYPKI